MHVNNPRRERDWLGSCLFLLRCSVDQWKKSATLSMKNQIWYSCTVQAEKNWWKKPHFEAASWWRRYHDTVNEIVAKGLIFLKWKSDIIILRAMGFYVKSYWSYEEIEGSYWSYVVKVGGGELWTPAEIEIEDKRSTLSNDRLHKQTSFQIFFVSYRDQ